MSRLYACASLLLAVALACADDSDGGEQDGDEAMVEPPPTPSFVDASALELWLSCDHDEPLVFVVEGMQADSYAELDGRALPLVGAAVSEPVLRAGDELVLPLAGALLPGDHELVVVTRFQGQELRSQSAVIHVEPSAPGPVTVTLEPAGVPAPPSARLVSHGRGDDAVLAMLGADQALLWFGGSGAGWSTPAQSVDLPGLTPGIAFEDRATLGLTWIGEQRWLVAVWAGGEPIEQALVQRWPVAEDGALGPAPSEAPLLLWSLDDEDLAALLGPHEARWISGVALLERTVVVALTARRDAESPTPGDRLLATRWLGVDLELGAPLLLRGSGGRDLEDLGQQLDPRLADLARGFSAPAPRLSLLLGDAFPISMAVAGNGLPQVYELEAGAVPLIGAGAGAGLRAIEGGGFGARHGFASLGDDQLRVAANDLWRGEGWSETVALPAPPSAQPAAAVLGGAPTLLVPHGVDVPVSLLRSTGEAMQLEGLADLGCDDIETWARDARSDDGAALDTVPLACLAAGELRMGALGG